ncbi:MAG: endopeptidase La, partial [Acidobacteria bacterium]
MSAAELKEDDAKQEERIQIPEILPVLPLEDVVTFPYMIVPLMISRERSISAVDQALARNRIIFLVAVRDQEAEDPAPKDIYDVGTVAMVIRMLKMPDQKVRILVQGVARASVASWDETVPYLQAKIRVLEETAPEISGLELEALVRNVKDSLEKAANLGKNISQEIMIIAANMDEPGRLADLAASNLALKVEDAQEVLSLLDPSRRLRRINE